MGPPHGNEWLDVVSLSTGRTIGRVPASDEHDIEWAVGARTYRLRRMGGEQPGTHARSASAASRTASPLGPEGSATSSPARSDSPVIWSELVQTGLRIGEFAAYLNLLDDFQ